MVTDIDRLKENLRRWTLVLGVLQITVGCVVGFIPTSRDEWMPKLFGEWPRSG